MTAALPLPVSRFHVGGVRVSVFGEQWTIEGDKD